MEDLVLSCLESRVEENRNLYARFLVGPFLRGDALTVATALRRVLLSSVESIGITALSIQGITHEFSTIAGVRESVLELSLNFGAIVLSYDKAFFQKKSFFDKLQIGYLQVQGPKVIYANDLKLPLGVKLVDPTQYIATVSKEGSIVLKFIISKRNNFGLGLVHQNIGSESHLENKAKQLSIVGEVGKKNIVRAKKTLPWPCLRALHPCRYLPYMPQRGHKGVKRGKKGGALTCAFAPCTGRVNLRERFAHARGVHLRYKQALAKLCTYKEEGAKTRHAKESACKSKICKRTPLQIGDLLGRAPMMQARHAFASLSTSNRSFYKNGFAINSFSGAWLQNSVLPLLGVRFVKGNTNRKIYKVNKKSFLECKAKSFKRCMIDNGTSNTSLSFENKQKLYNQNGAVLPLSPVRDLQDPTIHDLVRKKKEYAGVGSDHDHNLFKVLETKNNTNLRDLTSRNTDKTRRSSYKLKLCRKKEGGQSIRVKGSFAREALYSPCKSLIEICSFLEVAKQGGVQGKGKLLEKRNKSSYKAFHNLALAKLYSVTESTCTCAKGTKRGVERALASPLHQRCTPLACAKRSRRFGRACKASKRICVNQREKGKINKKKLKFLDDSSGNSNVFQSNICLRNVIPLDLTVTPILKVNFVIEIDDEVLYLRQKIRERIILEVWTNGSIHPRQAVHDSSLRLLDMFASFRSVYQVTST